MTTGSNPNRKNASYYLVNFLKETLSFQKGTDKRGTIQSIKDSIDFKGINVWILGCSIMIASIGLNVNSTAVVIGAMLISPLMGPILGMGLAIGINDFQTLIRSLKSFGIAVGISLLVSTLYFLITPLSQASPEIIARTEPTFLDVLIALFGGFAGIIAQSRRESSTVIPGVAIATALMPPLCTVGFGIAQGNWVYAGGALYLFSLNTVCITLATYIIVKYLKFPLKEQEDAQRTGKVKNYITIFAALVLLPSAYLFYNVIQKSFFNGQVTEFLSRYDLDETNVLDIKPDFKNKKVEVYVIGAYIDELAEKKMETALIAVDPDLFEGTDIQLIQSGSNTGELFSDMKSQLNADLRSSIIEDLYRGNQEVIDDQEKKISLLEEKLEEQLKTKADSLPITKLYKEFKIQYPALNKLAYSDAIEFGGIEKDTIHTFLVNWGKPFSYNSRRTQRKEAEKQMGKILQVRFDLDTCRVISF